MQYTVLLFYKYVELSDPAVVASRIRALAEDLSLTGRVLVSHEGINATLEGTTENTEAFLAELFEDERLADIQVKRSAGTGAAFPRLSVKVRNEIVGTRFPKNEANPLEKTAPRLTPDELQAMYEKNEDFVVIDMRNDYEYKSGHFRNSINPGLESSRDLPEALPKLEQFKNKKVVTVCTGGIRCEKMSAYLLSKGFEDVHQLENGMHGYMEKYPEGYFDGALYTFDQRVTMDFGGNRTVIGTCDRCEASTEHYENCNNMQCYKKFLICEDCISARGAYCGEACEVAVLSPSV